MQVNTPAALIEAVADSEKGTNIAYATGLHIIDDDMRKVAWSLYCDWKATLVQRRLGPSRFEYIAQVL